jgi:hypothetical protein
LSEFGRDPRRPKGVSSYCRDCRSAHAGSKRRYRPPQLTLSATQCAYLAGLVDGEGYVGVINCYRKKGDAVHHSGRMSIGMASEVLVALQQEFGVGSICRRGRQKENWKDVVIWSFGPNECRALLPLLVPYLRVKQRQATLLLSYLAIAKHPAREGVSSPQRVAEYRDAVNAILREMAPLNARAGVRRGRGSKPRRQNTLASGTDHR